MKKFTALLLVFVLALGMLAGCTSSGDGGADAVDDFHREGI